MTLRDCAPGSRVRLRRIVAAPGRVLRLTELGFVPGSILRVIGRGAMGGLIVAVGDARVAVDAETGRSLVVESLVVAHG